MAIEISAHLSTVLPPIKAVSDAAIWFGRTNELSNLGVVQDDIGLWNVWHLGPRNSEYRWRGAMREFANIEKSLVVDKSLQIRQNLRPDGPALVPFYIADRRYLKPVKDGGPQVEGFKENSTTYGDQGSVLAAYRYEQLFAVGGRALPSTLRLVDVSLEQLYEELASPEGGEIFMINPPASRGA